MNALHIAEYTQTLGLQAKMASALMAQAPAAIKNKALLALARLLRESVLPLQADNARDLDRARAAGLAEPMVDRLKLRCWRPAPRAASSSLPCPTSSARCSE
jgi:glutamate-5-semialdehyde dehydrogenase